MIYDNYRWSNYKLISKGVREMSEKPIWIYVERYRSKSGNKRKYTEKRHVKLQKKGKKPYGKQK